MLVPRLGEYLIQKGVITADDLQKALNLQQEEVAKGNHIMLGDALVNLKLIEHTALDQAVTEQIIQLRSALQAANRTLERRVEERTAELQKALERVSELSQLKANFISNISHELRTPLTHVKGYIELLVSESLGQITDEQRHALQVAQQSTSNLESLIEDLIMVSLSSRGELSLKQEQVDIRRLANLVVKSAVEKAEKRGVTLHAMADEDTPFVQADAQKIAWVLNHLIENGIKFTPSGGRVIVNVKREGENLVVVSVTDTGIGIPPERQKDVFEPFHQLDGSSTRHYGGTGLGLSLVREIVEAHGSMIEVQSLEGRGSSFKFPLLSAPAEK
ncbi:MAG: Adaptive-response sensory-kinase SasA [Anaerolineales bacterium]|nr:Adaptive-response sensory-kinase SasA [Anaerolineales bacterium]